MNQNNEMKKAVALRYDAEKQSAPKVIAKGQGQVAEKIIESAKGNEIHIHEDPALIEIMSKLELNQKVPEELYEAVAEIFAFVYRIDKEVESRQIVKKSIEN
ncbi:EscU/YscU/HrcU family type III secretion system export apparatus switch protein [Metabacillus sp. HB246100]